MKAEGGQIAGARGVGSAQDGGASAAEPPCFGEVLQQLQAVVEQLERSELPLEASLEAFEKGVALSRLGQSILDAAELKVEVLMRNGTTRPIDAGDG